MTPQEFREKYIRGIGTLVTCGQVVADFNQVVWDNTEQKLEAFRSEAKKKIDSEQQFIYEEGTRE